MLSADHCFDFGFEELDPSDMTFYLNYENFACDGDGGYINHTVLGGQLLVRDEATDFALIQLNRIPSSYNVYHAGWDRELSLENGSVGIHHPRGCAKKIAVDNEAVILKDEMWFFNGKWQEADDYLQVVFDLGATEPGSSGSPLFNHEGKIIGQLSGSEEEGCPNGNAPERIYGNFGNYFSQVGQWLRPNNTVLQSILGYSPNGWLHGRIPGGTIPSFKLVSAYSIGSMAVDDDRIFYRTSDNEISICEWKDDMWQYTGLYHSVWTGGGNDPRKVDGDIVTLSGQVFYRGDNHKVHVYYADGTINNGILWQHGVLGGWNAPSSDNVHAALGSMTTDGISSIIYRGWDNKLHTYKWTSGSGWEHSWIEGSNASQWHNAEGDVVAMGGQIFYRGVNDKINLYYKNSNNVWTHGVLGGWSAPANEEVSPNFGSMAVDGSTRIFYRGEDNKLHLYEWVVGSGWQHSWVLGQNAPAVTDIKGDIHYNNGQVVYRGVDAKIHICYETQEGWVHDWIEASWHAPSNHNSSGGITSLSDGQVVYSGWDFKLNVYYWKPSVEERRAKPTDEFVKTNNIKYKISPNPVFSDNIVLSFGEEVLGEADINIFDLQGKLLITQKSNIDIEGQVSLNIGGLMPGIYVTKVNTKFGQTGMQKFVKM